MGEISIRFLKEIELEQLLVLCKAHAEFEKAEWKNEHKLENLRTFLFCRNPPLYCLVAVKNEKIIGYATYMKQFSTWDAAYYYYMDCLFLTEETRGQGIGEKLIERIQEEGRRFQIKQIQWQTPDFNKRAMKFYRRIGAESRAKERFFIDIDQKASTQQNL